MAYIELERNGRLAVPILPSSSYTQGVTTWRIRGGEVSGSRVCCFGVRKRLSGHAAISLLRLSKSDDGKMEKRWCAWGFQSASERYLSLRFKVGKTQDGKFWTLIDSWGLKNGKIRRSSSISSMVWNWLSSFVVAKVKCRGAWSGQNTSQTSRNSLEAISLFGLGRKTNAGLAGSFKDALLEVLCLRLVVISRRIVGVSRRDKVDWGLSLTLTCSCSFEKIVFNKWPWGYSQNP